MAGSDQMRIPRVRRLDAVVETGEVRGGALSLMVTENGPVRTRQRLIPTGGIVAQPGHTRRSLFDLLSILVVVVRHAGLRHDSLDFVNLRTELFSSRNQTACDGGGHTGGVDEDVVRGIDIACADGRPEMVAGVVQYQERMDSFLVGVLRVTECVAQ